MEDAFLQAGGHAGRTRHATLALGTAIGPRGGGSKNIDRLKVRARGHLHVNAREIRVFPGQPLFSSRDPAETAPNPPLAIGLERALP
jgi:hypothetical protein